MNTATPTMKTLVAIRMRPSVKSVRPNLLSESVSIMSAAMNDRRITYLFHMQAWKAVLRGNFTHYFDVHENDRLSIISVIISSSQLSFPAPHVLRDDCKEVRGGHAEWRRLAEVDSR